MFLSMKPIAYGFQPMERKGNINKYLCFNLILHHTSCVTLDILFKFSEPHFPHMQNTGNPLQSCDGEMSIHVKTPTQHLARGNKH